MQFGDKFKATAPFVLGSGYSPFFFSQGDIITILHKASDGFLIGIDASIGPNTSIAISIEEMEQIHQYLSPIYSSQEDKGHPYTAIFK